MIKTQELFFTVVDGETGAQHRINFDVKVDDADNITGPATVKIKSLFAKSQIVIDPQQMAELGHLLIALSGHNYDHDSVDELLNGYDYGLVSIEQKFVKTMLDQLKKGCRL